MPNKRGKTPSSNECENQSSLIKVQDLDIQSSAKNEDGFQLGITISNSF